jgi:uncharacterized Fe-S center protein
MSSTKSEVYFGSVKQGKLTASASFGAKVDKITELLIEQTPINKREKVAIKMHLGFNVGYQTVPVFFVRRIVEAVKNTGAFPFITDNPTAVYNAVNRGYSHETCGCPIIPIAGVKDGYTTPVEIDFRGLNTLDLGGVLKDADVLIDLTHAKGHGACGYGGAIKNLALGGYSGATRWTKIHAVSQFDKYWDKEKGSQEHAQKLVEGCPYGALRYDSINKNIIRNYHDCHQCFQCLEMDSEIGAVRLPRESYSAFQEMMAISTDKVLETFRPEKVFDIGVLGSKDIIAIETATLDLIKKEGIIEKNIPPFLKHVNLDPNEDIHPFTRLHGAYKDPYETVRFLEKMGRGNSQYELIEILSPEETAKMAPEKKVFEGEPSFF